MVFTLNNSNTDNCSTFTEQSRIRHYCSVHTVCTTQIPINMHVLKFKREIKSQASEFLAINQHKAPCRNRTKVDSIDATSKYYFSPLVIGCRQTNDLCSYKTQDSFQRQKFGSPDLNYSIDMIRKNAL